MQQYVSEIGPLLQEGGTRVLGQSRQEDHQSKICIQDGVLYRQQGAETKMVLPQKVRDLVLHLGHSVPWQAILGDKRQLLVLAIIFWPNLGRDVGDFCRSCPECQFTAIIEPLKLP